MARLPKPLPTWAATDYLGGATAWAEAKRQCRTTLYAWARSGEPHTYTELTQRVTAIAWPEGAHTHEGGQLGFLLGQVSLEELDPEEDRPLISAMVIDKMDNMPSGGFWALCEELEIPVAKSKEARERFWLHEVAACRTRYGADVEANS
jgi:hypothetical protein